MVNKRSYSENIIKALFAVVSGLLAFIIVFSLSGIDLDKNFSGNFKRFDKQSDFVRVIDVGQGDSI